MVGKVVKIISTESVFDDFIGRYGVITEFAYGDKWKVEFKAKTKSTGNLIHTVSEKDFKVIGEIHQK